MTRHVILLGVALCCTSVAGAQKGKFKYDLKPQVLASKNGCSVAVDYSRNWQQPLKTFGGDAGSESLNSAATVSQLAYSIQTKGMVTAVAERNPRNFLEFAG